MTKQLAENIGKRYCYDCLGYPEVSVEDSMETSDAWIMLMHCPLQADPNFRFGLIVAKADASIITDDVSAYQYWNAKANPRKIRLSTWT